MSQLTPGACAIVNTPINESEEAGADKQEQLLSMCPQVSLKS